MEADSSPVAFSSFFYTIGRMVEENNDKEQWSINIADENLRANEWVPRITGVVTILSSLCLVLMAWLRRDRLFHRLVLGMSFHLTIQGVFLLYGTAAISCTDVNSPLGCSGTTATCSTQGFFIYVTTTTVLWEY